MLSVSPTTRVYLGPGPTDLRGCFERLFQMARTCFGLNPLEGDQVFAFCNKRRTRLKMIFHEGPAARQHHLHLTPCWFLYSRKWPKYDMIAKATM
jgi:hypothetical protein